jgi:lysophospholipase L1-like esterase
MNLLFKRTALVGFGVVAATGIEQGLRIRRAVATQEAMRVPCVDRPIEQASARVLVMGDSTGVGLGAGSHELAVAGRLGRALPSVHIVNRSRVGARLADVGEQLDHLDSSAVFDMALLHFGGNDILRGTPPRELEASAETMLGCVRKVAARQIWLGPADVGIAPLWRLPASMWMSHRSRVACRVFERVASRHDVHFLGFHTPEHSSEFRRAPRRYFAADGIHPSAEGYRYCYDRLVESPAARTAFAAAGCAIDGGSAAAPT